MGTYRNPQPAPERAPSFDDYLTEEGLRAAAARAALSSQEAQVPPEAMNLGPPKPEYEQDVPLEVIAELRRRHRAAPRGSDERKRGIQTMEKDGKKYRFDAYERQEAAGYNRLRHHGGFVNFLNRLGQEYAGGAPARAENIRQRERAQDIQREREGAETTAAWRETQVMEGRADRKQRSDLAGTEIDERAYGRAVDRFLRSQPAPMNEADKATADMHRSIAELNDAQRRSIQQGTGRYGDKGTGTAKPPYTYDQAWTNVRDAEAEIRAIEGELEQLVYKTDTPVELKDEKGNVYRTLDPYEAIKYRAQLQRDLAFYRNEHRKLREFIKNDGRVPDTELPEPPPDQGDGWGPDAEQPALEGDEGDLEGEDGEVIEDPEEPERGAATAEASGFHKDRRPIPPPHVRKQLAYRDQLYYQLSEEFPEASHAELMKMATRILQSTTAPKPSGYPPARPRDTR